MHCIFIKKLPIAEPKPLEKKIANFTKINNTCSKNYEFVPSPLPSRYGPVIVTT